MHPPTNLCKKRRITISQNITTTPPSTTTTPEPSIHVDSYNAIQPALLQIPNTTRPSRTMTPVPFNHDNPNNAIPVPSLEHIANPNNTNKIPILSKANTNNRSVANPGKREYDPRAEPILLKLLRGKKGYSSRKYKDQTLCHVCRCVLPLYQWDQHIPGSKHRSKMKKMGFFTKTCEFCRCQTTGHDYEKEFEDHLRSKKHVRLELWNKAQQYRAY